MQHLTRRRLLGHALASAALLPGTADAAQPITHRVQIAGMGFHPPRLHLAPGDRVIFTNADAARHSATADSGLFDSGPIGAEQSAQITCARPGIHTYFCATNPHMTGTLIIG